MVWPTEKAIKEYIQADVFCPWCESDEVKTHLPETDVTIAWQPHYCEKCNKEWNVMVIKGLLELQKVGYGQHHLKMMILF